MTAEPLDSIVSPVYRGFSGSPSSMEKIPFGSTAPLASLPPSLFPPPQAVAARATMIAPVTHLALLAPRMGSSS